MLAAPNLMRAPTAFSNATGMMATPRVFSKRFQWPSLYSCWPESVWPACRYAAGTRPCYIHQGCVFLNEPMYEYGAGKEFDEGGTADVLICGSATATAGELT